MDGVRPPIPSHARVFYLSEHNATARLACSETPACSPDRKRVFFEAHTDRSPLFFGVQAVAESALTREETLACVFTLE